MSFLFFGFPRPTLNHFIISAISTDLPLTIPSHVKIVLCSDGKAGGGTLAFSREGARPRDPQSPLPLSALSPRRARRAASAREEDPSMP